jgi:hypothetical protein
VVMNKYLTSKNLALLLINLVPLYGVLFLGWQAIIIIVFYVAETLIVGTLHVFKMAVLYIMNHNNPKALAVDRSANSGVSGFFYRLVSSPNEMIIIDGIWQRNPTALIRVLTNRNNYKRHTIKIHPINF